MSKSGEQLLVLPNLEENVEKWEIDELLEKIGWKNWRVLLRFVLTSNCWILTALFTMAPFFLNLENGECGATASNSSEECADQTSVIGEFKLYGSRIHLRHSLSTAFMVGCTIGGLITSFLSDKFGRRPVLLSCLVASGLGSLAVFFVWSFESFVVLRFAQGVSYSGVGLISWVLCCESMPSKLRSLASLSFGTTWILGQCLLALLALFLVQNWRIYLASFSVVCFLIAASVYLFVPESLHFLANNADSRQAKLWLKSSGAEDLIQKIDWNHFSKLESAESTKNAFQIAKMLFQNKKLLFGIICVSFLWSVDQFTYFGLAMFAVRLSGNAYVNFVSIAVVEILAYVVAPFFIDGLGRRPTISIGYLATAVVLVVVCFTAKTRILELLLWTTAKCTLSVAYMALMVFAVEVFPTAERNFCLGICQFVSKIAASFSVEIQRTAVFWHSVPIVIFSFLCFVSAIVPLFLRETNHSKLPDSIREIQS